MTAKEYFQKDLHRWYNGRKETFWERINRPVEIKYIYWLRKDFCAKNKLAKMYYRFRIKLIANKTQMLIHPKSEIGEGFYIGHPGDIHIRAKLGKNCNVSAGCTIGPTARGKRKGSPTLGDCVWVGLNAVVVGKIEIGDDVMIGPNAFVNFDVPSHSIVIGNPGKIIPRENATEGYINKKI